MHVYIQGMIIIYDGNLKKIHATNPQKSGAELRLLCDEDCSVPGQLTLSDFAWGSKAHAKEV